MLFISPHPNFQLTGIIPSQDEHHPGSGQYLRTVPGVDAEFFHGGCPAWAIDQAMQTPQFVQRWSGLPDGVDYRAYVSSYDTKFQQEEKGWSDETREEVERFLLKHPAFGDRYIVADPPSVTKDPPWANYDQTHHKQIVSIAQQTGCVEYAMEYEKEHKNRDSVITELLEVLQASPDEEFVPA